LFQFVVCALDHLMPLWISFRCSVAVLTFAVFVCRRFGLSPFWSVAVLSIDRTDTSDPRHFGPKTRRHHRYGSKMSRQFGTGSEVSVRQLGTSAELSAVRPLLVCDLSKNEQSYTLYRCDRPN